MGQALQYDPYHIKVIKGSLTRHISSQLSDIHDEILEALAEELPEELVEEVDVDAVDVSAAELIIVVGSATAVAPIPLRTADVVCYMRSLR